MKRIGTFIFGAVGYARILGLFIASLALPGVSMAQSSNPLLVLTPSTLNISEGESGTFTMILGAAPPGGTATITISPDDEVTVNPEEVTFVTSNYITPQRVTVTAVDDNDDDDELNVSVSFSATNVRTSGTDLTVNVKDDDKLILSTSSLSLDEGGSGTFTVKLSELPTSNVTVTLTQPSNTDVTVDTDTGTNGNQNTLTFAIGNWNSPQTVTVNVAQDDADISNENATITMSSSGDSLFGTSTASVSVAVEDNDSGSLTLSTNSLTIVEGLGTSFNVQLSAQPRSNVRVTLTQPTNGDVKVDTDTGTVGNQNTLDFTTGNWNSAQTVAVNVAQDDDLQSETASIPLSASGTGSGFHNVTASVGVNVTDNDTASLILPSNDVEVDEGDTETFDVRLSNQPSGNVTITLAQPSNGDVKVDTNTSQNGDQNTLTFTTGNWNANQSVTVKASDDNDLVDDTASIAVSASGGGFNSASGTVNVDVDDVDVAGFVLPSSDVEIEEGANGTFNVKLSNQPSGNVTVTLRQPSNTDVNLDTNTSQNGDQNTLTFTTGNWNTNQAVTVRAAHDDTLDNERASIAVSASGGGFNSASGTVNVAVTDDDEAEFILPSNDVEIDEGATGTFNMKLSAEPSGTVTVTLAQPTDNADVKVDTNTSQNGNQNTLTFTTGNWNTDQTVTVRVGDDDDLVDDTASISVSASGGGFNSASGTVNIDVEDVDIATLILPTADVEVEEEASDTFEVKLSNEPNANVTMTFRQPTDNTDVKVDTNAGQSGDQTTLTFTSTNWNTNQSVTVRVGADDDLVDDTATISVSAAGGGFGSATGSVSVAIEDVDIASLILPASDVDVDEGASETFDVKLSNQPNANVTLTLTEMMVNPGNPASNIDVDTDTGTTGNQNTLTFTDSNWNVNQRVTVTADEDDDAWDDEATISFASAGGGFDDATGTLGVDVSDDDEEALVLPTSALSINEGSNDTFDVKLATLPSGNVTLTLSLPNNTDMTLDSNLTGFGDQNTMTFTAANWNVNQQVRVYVGQDSDAVDERVSISFTAAGGGYATVTDSMEIAAVDDEEQSLSLPSSTIDIDEGRSATFKVRLLTRPNGNVSVILTQPSNGDVTVDTDTAAGTQNTLTFNATDWNRDKTVTVMTAQDDDALNDSATIALTASGADYGVVNGSVKIRVKDDDNPALVLSPASMDITEGTNDSFDVSLATRPSATVTVTLTQPSNTDVELDKTSLTFTTANWDDEQSVQVSVDDDPDASDESASIALSASGGDYLSVTGTVAVDVDDDETPALVFTPDQLSITEGASAGFDVKLASLPSANVTVTLTQPDNGDVKVDTDTSAAGDQVTLAFTAGNWNTNQRVSVKTSDDDDLVSDSASIPITATGGDYVNINQSVSVTVTDNDRAGLTVSPNTLDLTEGKSGAFTVRLTQKPGANVTVTLAQPSNTDVTVDKTSLTFTSANWDTERTVRVRTAHDDDALDESTSAIAISASGGGSDDGYASVTASVSVDVDDDEEEGLVLPPDALDIREGSSGSFSVKLASLPSASVRVSLTQPSNGDVKVDTDTATAGDQTVLTFTTTDWDSLKTVTVTIAEDADSSDEDASIALSASGGGYDGVSSTVDVKGSDNDTKAVLIDVRALSFTEGESDRFKVRLGTLPSGNVTVALRQRESNADLTTDKSSLTFTTTTWDKEQTVTIASSEDDDTALDETTLTLMASGGGYDNVTETLMVRVTDNDSPGLTLSTGDFEMTEGTDTLLMVRLAKQPNAEDRSVEVRLVSNNPDVAFDKSSLTFSGGTWNTGQAVMISAAHDDDGRNESARLDYTAAGGEYDGVAGSLLIEVIDDDLVLPPGSEERILALPGTIEIEEGASASFGVKLDGIVPTSEITISMANANKDIAFSPSSLVFTPSDWDEEQTITVSAGNDSDSVNDSDIITLVAAGIELPPAQVSVKVMDDESTAPPPGGALGSIIVAPESLVLSEGMSKTFGVRLEGGPRNADITLSMRKTNDDITLSPFSLTFTPSDLNDEQIVTLTAASDGDGADDSDLITMTARGGGYEGVMQRLPVAVIDNPGMVEVSPDTIELKAGGSANSFVVGLGVEPIDTEAVIVSLSSSNPGISFSPAYLVFAGNDWNRRRNVSAKAADGSNRQGGLDVIALDATGGNYAGVQGTISVQYIEEEIRIARPAPTDPLRSHALGIPPAVSGDQATVSISCRQDRPCAALLDCTAQNDGSVFQGEIPGVIPGWGRITLTAKDIEDYTGDSWSGKGRLACDLRSVGRVESQVWTRSGDGVLVNNSAYIRSHLEGERHRADIESLTSPEGLEKSNIRIRCMAMRGQACRSMIFDCYEDHGKHRRSEPFEIGSSIVRHLQSAELAEMIGYRWRGQKMSCELRSSAPFTVQILTRTGGGGALVNNSGGGSARLGD